MMMNGVAPSVLNDELNANAASREQLEAQLAATEDPPPLLHPEMARTYRPKVEELAKALHEPESRSEATEALRGLAHRSTCGPRHPQPGGLLGTEARVSGGLLARNLVGVAGQSGFGRCAPSPHWEVLLVTHGSHPARHRAAQIVYDPSGPSWSGNS
jgi:hypothetical protein